MIQIWILNLLFALYSIYMNNNFYKLAIVLSNTCNLRCKYCYLNDKDNIIQQPINFQQYIDKFLQYNNNNVNSLTTIDLWGGEPLLKLDKFLNYLSVYLSTFPNLKIFNISSNFTLSNSTILILRFLEILNNYGRINDKQYELHLQISIDGQPLINDFNRGQNSTNLVLSNYNNLISELMNLNLTNVNLFITTKSTFNEDNLSNDNLDIIINDWFTFFINNFYNQNVNIKCNLFDIEKKYTPWQTMSCLNYRYCLQIADQWKQNHSEYNDFFVFPKYNCQVIQLCEVGLIDKVLILNQENKRIVCHYDNNTLFDETKRPFIKLSTIYNTMIKLYGFQDFMTLDEYKKSLLIYISRNWCPYKLYEFNTKNEVPDLLSNWFFNEFNMIYESGAIKILLKWSEEDGQI